MNEKRIARQVKCLMSAALLAVGIAACSGVGDETSDGSSATKDSTVNQSVAPNPDESTAAIFCNGCYISATACKQQIAPGSGCNCFQFACGCSGSAPFGMICG